MQSDAQMQPNWQMFKSATPEASVRKGGKKINHLSLMSTTHDA